MENSQDGYQEKADKSSIYQAVRDQIVHEDNLVNQRFTWTLTTTGFLIAGYSLLLSSLDKFENQRILFVCLLISICIVGFLTCLFFRTEINKSDEAYNNIRSFWYGKFKEEGNAIGYNFFNENPKKEYSDVHHNAPYKGWFQQKFPKFRRGAHMVSNTLMGLWVVLIEVGLYFVYGPFFKESLIKKDSYPIVRRSTLAGDTTVYIDTLYLPKENKEK